jgi:hypothetical protein
MDQWWFLTRLRLLGGGSPLRFLWEQHNEHRILVPRLFYLTDLYVFGGSNRFLLIVLYAIQLAHLCLFGWIFGHLGGLRGKHWRTVVGIAAFCLFLPVPEIFTRGWEIAWVLPFFCATAGVAAVARLASAGGFRSSWIVISWLAALVASLTLSNGFLVWPLLCLTIVLLRVRKAAIFATGLVGAVAVALNSIGYKSGRAQALDGTGSKFLAGADPIGALRHPGAIADFVLRCFAASWPAPIQTLAFWVSVIAIVATLAGMLWIFVRRPRSLVFVVVLLLAAFQILTATVIALARWNLGIADRYQATVMLFWAFMGGICVLAMATRAAPMVLALFQIAILALMAMAAPRFSSILREVQTRKQSLAIEAAALATGVDDLETLYELPRKDSAFASSEFLHDQHRSFFRLAPERALGRSTREFAVTSVQRCEGQIDFVEPVADQRWPGARVSGFAWDRQLQKPVEQIILATDGVVRGIGNSDILVRSSGTGPDSPGQHSTWRAFLPPAVKAVTLQAYGMLDEHTVCALGGSRQISADAFSVKALYTSESDLAGMVPLWRPSDGVPTIYDGAAAINGKTLVIHSTGIDTQMFFPSPVRLNRFHIIVFKALFEKSDLLELFFGQMINGRGISGTVPIAGEWVYVFANVGTNPYWKDEAGIRFRFDPTSAAAAGSTVRIAGVWGEEAQLPDRTPSFETKLCADPPK